MSDSGDDFVAGAVDLFDQLRGYDERHDIAFDDIVSIAATICDTPIALVSFLNDSEQWFKAKVGLDLDGTRRDVAFCAHTVDGGEMLVVDDAALDPRFAGNPLVLSDPHVRSYAGTPLRVGDLKVIGTLCVLDRRPRQLSAVQLRALQALGRQVERLLELQIATAEREAHHVELLERDNRFTSVIRALAQGVVVHARDGSIERTNPAAVQSLGMTESQMFGKTPIDPTCNAIHPDGSPFPGDEHPASVTLATGREVDGIVMGVQHVDGPRRWLMVSSVPLLDSQSRPAGAVATFIDMTDLLVINARLQQSLDHVAAATLERATMLAALSHDLRAPLAAIKLRSELLRDRSGELPAGHAQEILDRIHQDADDTARMLDDLVASDRSIAELLPPRRVEVDVAALLVSAVSSFDVPTHTIESIEVDTPEIVFADPVQLERIIDNLIHNAVNYTPSGSTVSVGVSANDDWVELFVDDNGPGVLAADVETIFDAYTRGLAAGSTPGTGLGLFLVRRFAEFNGATVRYETSRRGGARFIVRLARGQGSASSETTT